MAIFDKLFKRSRSIAPMMVQLPFGKNGVPIPNVTASMAMAKNSDVYSVINRISSDVATCPMVCSNAQVEAKLATPSKLLNRFNFWQEVVAQLLLNGNAVVTLGDQLEVIPFENVQINLLYNLQDLTYRITYNDNRPMMEYASREVLHFKLVATGQVDSEYCGISPLNSLFPDLALQEMSKDLTKKVLENGLNPRAILTAPIVLSPEDKKAVRSSFEKVNMGDNNGKAIVLDQGLQLTTLNVSQDVANYLKNYNFSQNQIAKAFGVPATYLNGEGDQQSSVEMLRSMYTDSLQMYIKPIEAELSFKFGVPVEMDITHAVDVDNTNLITQLTQLTSSGIITVDEAHDILAKRGVLNG